MKMNDVALRTNDVMLRINGELQFCTMTPKCTVDHLVYGIFSIPRANILHKQKFAREPTRLTVTRE